MKVKNILNNMIIVVKKKEEIKAINFFLKTNTTKRHVLQLMK